MSTKVPQPTDKDRSKRLSLAIFAGAFVVALIFWFFRPKQEGPVVDDEVLAKATPTPQQLHINTTGSVDFVVYIPNSNALLTKKIYKKKNPFPGSPTWNVKAGYTLDLLFRHLKDLPVGTKLLAIPQRDKDGVVTVNISRDFLALDNASETTLNLMLDAMVKTMGAVDDPNGPPVKMKIIIEGGPLNQLGEVDLGEPWTSTQPGDEAPQSPKDAT